MARALRLEFEGALYHICARGNRREAIFAGDRDRICFLKLIEQSLARYDVELHAYVLLPNHFHLLARTRRANLSRWMHWLSASYSIYFNRRHRSSGHLFQGRYKSFVVQGGEYLLGVGRLFGGINYAAVSQRIRRLEQAMASNRSLRRTCQMLNV